jgi:hypothetical protein
MAYQDNKYKQRGVQREPIIMEGVIHSLRKSGYPQASSKKTTLSENMNQKMDYRIFPGKHQSFKGYHSIPVDIKSGTTYTLITTTGENTLEKSKSVFLVYEFDRSDDYYVFIKVDALRKLVKEYPPELKNSRFNSSIYFSMVDYVYENMDRFKLDEDYFEIAK